MNNYTNTLLVWFFKGQKSAAVISHKDWNEKIAPILKEIAKPLNDTGKAILNSIDMTAPKE
jgi:hypothetical protein